MNTQLPEKQRFRVGGELEVFGIFRSIQGEGPFAGTPAVFVRLAGCNLACPRCDTDYMSVRDILRPDEVLDRIGRLWGLDSDLIVLTGGEPFRQNIRPLVDFLLSDGQRVQIETNGTLYLDLPDDDRLSVVCSPKTPKVDTELECWVNAWKYVLRSREVDNRDGLPLELFRPSGRHASIYVQPMDEKDEHKNRENLAVVVNSCMKFGYKLSLQIHKLIGVE